MSAPISMDAVHTVESIETVRVISDPLRIDLLDEIGLANDRGELRTVKQLAAALKTSPQKLYYHVNLLENHGLIRVAETQIVSGILEKHYALTSRRIRIARHLFEAGYLGSKKTQAALGLFDSAVEAAREDFVELVRTAGTPQGSPALFAGRHGHLTHERVRMTRQQAEAFHARLAALTEEFGAAGAPEGGGDTAVYSLLTVLLPSAPRESGE